MRAKVKLSPRSAEDVVKVRSRDEKSWWTSRDPFEPLMGVPAVTGGVMPAPLPDGRPSQPQPGLGHEQEDGEHVPAFEVPEWERLGS